jgi:hypothetical protein
VWSFDPRLPAFKGSVHLLVLLLLLLLLVPWAASMLRTRGGDLEIHGDDARRRG